PELQSVLVRIIGDKRQAVRKFLRIGIPVAYTAKPSSIDMEHVDAEVSAIANHAQGNLFVDRHPAAPAVIHDQGIAWIFPGFGIAEHRAHPATKNISRAVGAIVKSAKKNHRGFERLARRQTRAKRPWIWVEPQRSLNRIFFAFQ